MGGRKKLQVEKERERWGRTCCQIRRRLSFLPPSLTRVPPGEKGRNSASDAFPFYLLQCILEENKASCYRGGEQANLVSFEHRTVYTVHCKKVRKSWLMLSDGLLLLLLPFPFSILPVRLLLLLRPLSHSSSGYGGLLGGVGRNRRKRAQHHVFPPSSPWIYVKM